jgi:hypothetical protein
MRGSTVRSFVVTIGAAAGALLAPAPPAARASLVLALDTPAMVAQADTIAIVDVGATRAAWDERHERIVTSIELAVVETWKGTPAPAARIVVAQPGGTVGDITMVVSGVPRFAAGERALVFLRGPAGRASVVGLAQGKRLVRRDAAGAGFVVAPVDRAGASFVRGGAPGGRPPVFETEPRPLDDVRAEIRALVAGGGAR